MAATPSLNFSGAAWNYDDTNDVYYQIGRYYAAKPGAAAIETLSAAGDLREAAANLFAALRRLDALAATSTASR